MGNMEKSKIFTYHRLESGWKYTENIKIYEIPVVYCK